MWRPGTLKKEESAGRMRERGGTPDEGVHVEREGSLVMITGLPYASGIECDLANKSYLITWTDGEPPSKGANPEWEDKTVVRYALLAYRNGLNSRVNQILWPRAQREATTGRSVLLRQLAEQQSQQQSLLLALAKKLEAI